MTPHSPKPYEFRKRQDTISGSPREVQTGCPSQEHVPWSVAPRKETQDEGVLPTVTRVLDVHFFKFFNLGIGAHGLPRTHGNEERCHFYDLQPYNN